MQQRIKVRWLMMGSVFAMALVAALPVSAQDDKSVGSDELGVAIVDKGDDAAEIEKIGVWHTQGQLGLNLIQSAFSNNWNGGDKGSMSWNSTFQGVAEKQLTERWNWFNRMRLAYGQIHQQERNDGGELFWKEAEKTNDEIDIESLLRITTTGGWDPYGSLRFQSQFQDVSDPYGRSINFNPLDFRIGAGVSRTLINKDQHRLLARFGLALRQLSRSYYIAAPDSSDQTERTNPSDGGLELRIDYVTPLLKDRVTWVSRLTVYKPLFYSADKDFDQIAPTDYGLDSDIADYAKVADVDWQNTFATQITKVISVNLDIRWIYDKYDNSIAPVVEDGMLTNPGAVGAAVRKEGQYRQVLSLGLVYNFGTAAE